MQIVDGLEGLRPQLLKRDALGKSEARRSRLLGKDLDRKPRRDVLLERRTSKSCGSGSSTMPTLYRRRSREPPPLSQLR
jgi:hypothetical protein